MLLDATVAVRGLDMVTADDFYRHAHRQIYISMARVTEERLTVDLVTVKNDLTQHGLIEEVGGPAYISALIDGVARSSNIQDYAEIVKEMRRRRQILQYASKIQQAVSEGSRSSRELLDNADRMLAKLIGIGGNETDLVEHGVYVPEFIADLEHRIAHKYELLGLSTGLPSLDDATCGLCEGDMTVLAGQTSAGKTALMAQIALVCAETGITTNGAVVVESIEMSRKQVQCRIASHLSGVELFKVRKGLLFNQEIDQVKEAMRRTISWPLYVDEAPTVTVRELRAKCRRLAGMRRIRLVVVDYLQLLTSDSDRSGRSGDNNRATEVGNMARGLKLLAGELQCHVIALAQLNRDPQKKMRRPELSDLRESGAIEQHADSVWMLYKDESKADSPTELLIRKQRNGPPGVVDLDFSKPYQRFHDIAAEKAADRQPAQADLPPFA